MPTNVDVDRLLAEMEETERRHDAAASAEFQRMRRNAKYQPIPPLKPLQLFVGIVLCGGTVLTLTYWWLNGWHF